MCLIMTCFLRELESREVHEDQTILKGMCCETRHLPWGKILMAFYGQDYQWACWFSIRVFLCMCVWNSILKSTRKLQSCQLFCTSIHFWHPTRTIKKSWYYFILCVFQLVLRGVVMTCISLGWFILLGQASSDLPQLCLAWVSWGTARGPRYAQVISSCLWINAPSQVYLKIQDHGPPKGCCFVFFGTGRTNQTKPLGWS